MDKNCKLTHDLVVAGGDLTYGAAEPLLLLELGKPRLGKSRLGGSHRHDGDKAEGGEGP